MSDQAHVWTDEELARLERRIERLYSEAAKDMDAQVKAYFESFEKRDDEYRALVAAGEKTEQEYKQWRITQIGRGKRYEAMRDQLADRMTHANEIATAYINGEIPKIYAYNHRHTIGDVVEQSGGMISGMDFTMLNEHMVKRLIAENPDLMPYYPPARALQRGIDLEYGKKQITKSVTSGLLKGDSTNKIAKDLMNHITNMEKVSAIRAARTAITQAQNAGRQAATEELAKQGVIMKKVWLAMDDKRSRVVGGKRIHVEANGQEQDIDAPFIVGGEELMFPGDASMGASGWNLYNCRCTRYNKVIGFKSVLTDAQRKKANIKVIKY